MTETPETEIETPPEATPAADTAAIPAAAPDADTPTEVSADPAPETPSARDDADVIVIFYGESDEQLLKAIEDRARVLGGMAALEAQTNATPGGYDHVLLRQNIPNPEAMETQTRLRHVLDQGGELRHVLKDADGKTVLGVLQPKPRASTGPQKMEGKEALLAFRRHSQRGSLRRIPLYNSGFYIDLVGPSASMLNNFIEQADVTTEEFGRMFGAVFYTHADHYVKEAAFRLFRPLITHASLKNWDRGNVLANAIRLEDYDTILMAVAALMYPQGFKGFRRACTNSQRCSHEIEVDVDLTKMVYTNFGLLNKDAIAHMRKAATGEVTQEELVEYQKLIPFVEGDLDNPDATRNLVRWQNWGFVLQSPNYFQYINAGGRYLDTIMDSINRDDRAAVSRSVRVRIIRQLAPWIGELRAYASEDSDQIDITTSDPATIEELLDHIQTEDYDDMVFDTIANLIDRHKISHVGYPTFACPACGHEPVTPSGFFTVEPMETFFMMCARKLARRD